MWTLALVLLTCLSIDVTNPLLPGVVRFDGGESTYWLGAERPRTSEPFPATPMPVLPSPSRGAIAPPPRGATPRRRRPPAPPAPDRPGATEVARAAPAADEDH